MSLEYKTISVHSVYIWGQKSKPATLKFNSAGWVVNAVLSEITLIQYNGKELRLPILSFRIRRLSMNWVLRWWPLFASLKSKKCKTEDSCTIIERKINVASSGSTNEEKMFLGRIKTTNVKKVYESGVVYRSERYFVRRGSLSELIQSASCNDTLWTLSANAKI